LGRKFFFGKKSYQYPNSNSSLFGLIVEKRVGSFSRRYGQFGPVQKVSFLNWPFLGPFATSHTRYGPKILPNPKLLDGTFVR